MKTRTNSTALFLLLLFSAATAFPQQPVPVTPVVPTEKKRAMNKFDPVDIFPEAKERGGKDRNKRSKDSASASTVGNNSFSTSDTSGNTPSASRQRSRRRGRSEPDSDKERNSESVLAAAPAATPTPAVEPAASPTPAPANVVAEASPTATPSEPVSVMGGAASLTTPPSRPLVAANQSSAVPASAATGKNAGLSLPIILTLISVVLLALIVAVTRLMKQVRKAAN